MTVILTLNFIRNVVPRRIRLVRFSMQKKQPSR